jgi:2-oxo-4-hydroxy-4-carboxy-5-ureidoimidazoline decarboxylase
MLNNATADQAFSIIEACCCAPRWVEAMVASRPFLTKQAVFETAQVIWQSLDEHDYLIAFEGHPQIGDISTLKAKYASTSQVAGHEQAGMSLAQEDLLKEMAQVNQDYLHKFGFIFIVCASGKSAEQMLNLIKNRITNSPAVELSIAAQEQAKITQIRLEKLL